MTDPKESSPRDGSSGGNPSGGRGVIGRRLRRLALLAFGVALAIPLLYVGAAEVGMRLAKDGESDALEGTIDVYFFSSGPHVDVWVPSVHPEFSWRDRLPNGFPLSRTGYLAIGWGDRVFYTEVPTWADLTPGVAVRGALWPTPTAVRVTSYPYGPKMDERCHLVRVDPAAYRRLCEYITGSIELDEQGRAVPIDFEGYGAGLADRFFEGRGSYHMFHTCNSWTNGALAAAGKQSASWAVFPRGVLHHLPANQGSAEGSSPKND